MTHDSCNTTCLRLRAMPHVRVWVQEIARLRKEDGKLQDHDSSHLRGKERFKHIATRIAGVASVVKRLSMPSIMRRLNSLRMQLNKDVRFPTFLCTENPFSHAQHACMRRIHLQPVRVELFTICAACLSPLCLRLTVRGAKSNISKKPLPTLNSTLKYIQFLA